jgi:hypothetical protein
VNSRPHAGCLIAFGVGFAGFCGFRCMGGVMDEREWAF